MAWLELLNGPKPFSYRLDTSNSDGIRAEVFYLEDGTANKEEFKRVGEVFLLHGSSKWDLIEFGEPKHTGLLPKRRVGRYYGLEKAMEAAKENWGADTVIY